MYYIKLHSRGWKQCEIKKSVNFYEALENFSSTTFVLIEKITNNPHINVLWWLEKHCFITMISLETNCCLFLCLSVFSALIIFHILIFKLTEGVNTKIILSMETNTKAFFAFSCLLQITLRIQKKLCYYFNTASYFDVSFFSRSHTDLENSIKFLIFVAVSAIQWIFLRPLSYKMHWNDAFKDNFAKVHIYEKYGSD